MPTPPGAALAKNAHLAVRPTSLALRHATLSAIVIWGQTYHGAGVHGVRLASIPSALNGTVLIAM